MSASAIVTVTLRVVLSQPWSNKATVEEILRQAKAEALNTIRELIIGQHSINLVEDPKVKVIYEEGR